MIRPSFEPGWRSTSRWKRRFYSSYMKWLERIGYAIALLTIAGFIFAFNYRVDDTIKADGVTIEAASELVKATEPTQITRVLSKDFEMVSKGQALIELVVGSRNILGYRVAAWLPGGMGNYNTTILRSPATGVFRLPKNWEDHEFAKDDELLRISDYSKLTLNAKLKGESVAKAAIGQEAKIYGIAIGGTSLLRGELQGMEGSVFSRSVLGEEFQKSLDKDLKGQTVKTRQDVPLTITEVTEVQIDAGLVVAKGGANGSRFDPPPSLTLKGILISGEQNLTAQIATLPTNAERSATNLLNETIQGKEFQLPTLDGIRIARVEKPRYIVTVKAKAALGTHTTTADMPGSQLDRNVSGKIQITDPPQFLMDAVRESDRSGRTVTATVEIRTGTKPIALVLIRKS